MTQISTMGLTITVPDGWSSVEKQGEPLTLELSGEDVWGVLQISRLPDEHLDFIRESADLGAVAIQIGQGLGDGWGEASSSKEFTAKLGRLGLAAFPQGEYPVMMLFVGLTEDSAYLFTWLGPDINQEALGMVMTAERS